MNNIYNDNEYLNIIDDILYNNEFKKIASNIHHGLSRLDHSLRVSYYSYKFSKILFLDSKEVARAGLLHDFFISQGNSKKERTISIFVHPKKALANSDRLFNLSDKEKNIIEAHMFPVIPNKIPKYLESWIVSLVDKIVATYEFSYSCSTKTLCKIPNAYFVSLLLLFRLGL